jgi:hypothetical protein
MTSTDTPPLPRWAYGALGVACAPMAAWAALTNLEYFQYGASVLEADPALRAMAVTTATMFVVLCAAASFLPSLLTGAQLWAHRWKLIGFMFAVIGMEGATTVVTQRALITEAAVSQATVEKNIADLEKRIAQHNAKSDTYISQARGLDANNQKTFGRRTEDLSTAELAKNEDLYKQLADERKKLRPTTAGVLSLEKAILYAEARGLLVVFASVIFSSLMGAMFQLAAGGTPPAQRVILALANKMNRPGWLGRRMPIPGPVAAAAGAAGAAAVPMANAAPAPSIPTPITISVPAQAPSKTYLTPHVQPKVVLTKYTPAPVAVTKSVPVADAAPVQVVPEQVPAAVPEQVPPVAVSLEKAEPVVPAPTVKKVRASRPKRVQSDAGRYDTGTKGDNAVRYGRVVDAVRLGPKKGGIKPSIGAIQTAAGCNQELAERFRVAMADDGIIVLQRDSQGNPRPGWYELKA